MPKTRREKAKNFKMTGLPKNLEASLRSYEARLNGKPLAQHQGAGAIRHAEESNSLIKKAVRK